MLVNLIFSAMIEVFNAFWTDKETLKFVVYIYLLP